MTAFSVRHGSLSNLDALVALESASFNYDQLSRRSFRRFLSRTPNYLWCAEEGTSLLGYILILTRKNSQVWRIYSLVTAAQSRGQGVASALLHCAIEQARSANVTTLSLEVKAVNHSAISLYQRAGFEVMEKRQGYYSDGTDALRMILKL